MQDSRGVYITPCLPGVPGFTLAYTDVGGSSRRVPVDTHLYLGMRSAKTVDDLRRYTVEGRPGGVLGSFPLLQR